VFSTAAFVSPPSEARIEASTQSLCSDSDQQLYSQMLHVLAQTNSKLDLLSSSHTAASTSATPQSTREGPLPLDPTLCSEWSDFHDSVDLLFTTDNATGDNMRARMERVARATQEHLCHELEALEAQYTEPNTTPAQFQNDLWKRPSSRCGAASLHAGGYSKVLQNGKVFEKAGVSVSISSGKLPQRAVQQMTANHNKLQTLLSNNELGDLEGNVQYFAASVSSVVHPHNPHAPTGHFNYRYFELGDVDESGAFTSKVWWFGGGGDLSPSVLDATDCRHFHQTLKRCCDRHDEAFYGEFKKWCDDYFVIRHRDDERRGVGGIFFDDISNLRSREIGDSAEAKEAVFAFVRDCASHWAEAFVPLVARHQRQSFSEREREWQQMRRGRYVEFNLVYDRGTKFGLMKPGARVESILMSMPLTARWEYSRDAEEGTFEQEMYDVFKNPREWA